MGFENATCSLTRFRIVDDVPASLWTEVTDRLRQHAFLDIDGMAEMQSIGWCCFDDMRDVDWHTAPPQKGEYIVFSLRKDTRRIPPAVIKKHMDDALDAERATLRAQGKTFISRERRKELKAQVLLRLRERFLPTPAFFNVLWLPERNEVWLASTNPGIVDIFMTLYQHTFDLNLEQITPHTLAIDMLGGAREEEVTAVEETDFAVVDGTRKVSGDTTPDQILGSEFLTWLWFKSDGLPASRQTIPSNIRVSGRIVVRGEHGMGRSTMAMTARLSRFQEALFWLALGKRISKAHVDIGEPEAPFPMTLDADTLSISGLRTPTPKLESDGGDDALEADARLLLRIDSMETAVHLLEQFYWRFIECRFSPAWAAESDAMRTWIAEEARVENA